MPHLQTSKARASIPKISDLNPPRVQKVAIVIKSTLCICNIKKAEPGSAFFMRIAFDSAFPEFPWRHTRHFFEKAGKVVYAFKIKLL